MSRPPPVAVQTFLKAATRTLWFKVVAWASEKTPDLDEAAQAASRWFGEPRESR
jgi:hypothetical protein